MTDTDLTAPERIWANPDHWIEHPPRRDAFRPEEYFEYVRADLSAALETERAELAGLKDAYTGAMEDKRMWKRRAEALDAKLKEAVDMLGDAVKYWVAVDPEAESSVEVMAMRAFLASIGGKP